MKKSNFWVYLTIITLVLGGSFGFVWFQSSQIHSEETVDFASLSKLDQGIATAERELEREPNNIELALALTDGYLQKIRETGDVALYEKIDQVLAAVATPETNVAGMLAKRAEVANGRHDFNAGLDFSTQAVSMEPGVAAYWGIKSDAEVELGLYEAAEDSLQRMVDLKPNFSSFARVAYQRELHGDSEGAIEALKAALSASSVHAENVAWAHVELGKLQLRSDLTEAEKNFTIALTLFPDYAPALEGLGRVNFVKGNSSAALTYYTRAFEVLPVAQYAVALGQYYEVTGNQSKASQLYTLADLAFLSQVGINTDLEYAVFLADHGDSHKALILAEAAYKNRPSVFAADSYAWALFKSNNISEALAMSGEALRLGQNDSTVVYHAAVIAEANGKTNEVKAMYKTAQSLNQFASIAITESLKNKN